MYQTDLTIRSLHMLRTILEGESLPSMRLFLVHGYSLPDSITDLLFFSKKEVIAAIADKAFREACDVLQNRFPAISTLEVDLFSGWSQSAFDGYMSARGISRIYKPLGTNFELKNRNSFDFSRFYKKSGLETIEFGHVRHDFFKGSTTLVDLF